MSKKRVVVTGMGAITPIGLSVDEFWSSVKEGKLGFAPITRFDTSEYKCHVAAEVKDFEGKNYMDFKSAKKMEKEDRFTRFFYKPSTIRLLGWLFHYFPRVIKWSFDYALRP